MEVTAPARPELKTYTLHDRTGDVIFRGRHLGHGTSWQVNKDRWFEVDIYRTRNDYVVYTQGKTRVAGEVTFVRVARTTSAFEILELLTVQHNGKIYLPRQSSRALSQAAQWDDDIRDAYINRAVV